MVDIILSDVDLFSLWRIHTGTSCSPTMFTLNIRTSLVLTIIVIKFEYHMLLELKCMKNIIFSP